MASKQLARELNKRLVDTRFEKVMQFHGIILDQDNYCRFVSNDLFDMELDHIKSSGRYRTIKITYAPEYYAMPRYVSTRELLACFTPGDTIEDFAKRVFEEFEV